MLKLNHINEYPSLPGIYKFTNKINRKVYIGESKNLKVRMRGYKGSYRNKKIIHLISRAMLKYGIDGFSYEILEIFPIGVSKEILLDREEFWIHIYNATDKNIGYNLTKRGRNRKGITASLETREKMRQANLGRKHKKETCIKMGFSRSGDNHWTKKLGDKKNPMLGRKFSKERVDKMKKWLTSIVKKGSYKKVNQLDPKTGKILSSFESIGHAAEIVNGNKKKYHGISRALNGGKPVAYGFKWEYAK